MRVIICCIGVIAAQCVLAAPIEPSMGAIITSAGVGKTDDKTIVRPASLSSGSVAIKVTPVFLPNINSPSWITAANALIADAEAGTLSANTTVLSPTQYAVCNSSHTIGWTNLVLSTYTPLWGGVFNPPAPFNNELGGPLVWFLIDANSLSNENNVSLDSLSATGVSAPDGDYLGATTGFAGDSYTPRAVVIKSDGTIITSGPASQRGARVLVLVQTKLLSADSPFDLNNDQDWVNFYSPYMLTCTAQVIGDDSTKSSTTVSTVPAVFPSGVAVSIKADGTSTVSLSVSNASTNLSYRIWSTASLNPPTQWHFVGIINGTDSMSISTMAGPMFYRASIQ